MDSDNQGPTVFDINKPHTYGANPSARPVITGHQPQIPDPMLNPVEDAPSDGAKINVRVNDSAQTSGLDADSLASSLFPKAAAATEPEKMISNPALMEGEPQLSPPFTPDVDNQSAAQRAPYMPVSDLTGINTSSNPSPRPVGDEASDQQVTTDPKPSVYGRSSSNAMEDPKLPKEPKKKSKTWLWIVGILVVLAGLYAAIDKNLILSNVNLPLHIFSQPSTGTSTNTAADIATAASLPTGFTSTKLVDAGVLFAYPTVWGAPVAAVDQGFAKRTKDGKPDTPHAYVLTFPSNKDVELAVTSSKVLAPSRTSLYYDFLGWCVGTVDGKYYFGVLHFMTTNGVDTPSTVTCGDQPPLDNPTKLTDDTIVQTNLKTSDGKDAGDIYTKNLTDNPNFAVIRARDASMKNTEQIKTLLATFENLLAQ